MTIAATIAVDDWDVLYSLSVIVAVIVNPFPAFILFIQFLTVPRISF